MTGSRKINKLKKEAKRLYLRYNEVVDSLPCGRDLAEYISSEALSCKIEFNRVMDELSKLDPNCPQSRL